jgi:ribosomal 50S subunit-recycling heat shock protein
VTFAFTPESAGQGRNSLPPVDLPFYSATIIQVSVPEAAMATRRKAKGKAGGKQKKAPVTKLATRRKAARKAKTTSKKTAKKVFPRSASTKKTKPTAKTTFKPAPQSASREQRIGVVTHYYSHLSVATMRLEPGTTLKVGDLIHIHGHTTDFTQKVDSLEVDHAPVIEVGPNDDFGLKVIEHAREHDAVFKVRS